MTKVLFDSEDAKTAKTAADNGEFVLNDGLSAALTFVVLLPDFVL